MKKIYNIKFYFFFDQSPSTMVWSMQQVEENYKRLEVVLQSTELFRGICMKQAASELKECQLQNRDDGECEKQIVAFAREISDESNSPCVNGL